MAAATARNLTQTPTTSLEMNGDFTPDRDDDRLLDARQVAAKLGVSERFIRDHTTRRSPRIAGVKLGKLLRYRATDVEIFMAELNTLPTSRRS
jgi:predicted DNA-binding transcriptional regulator AlpA